MAAIHDRMPVILHEEPEPSSSASRLPRPNYERLVHGVRRLVTAAYDQPGDDITRRNLASMIRQSGLPKKLFR